MFKLQSRIFSYRVLVFCAIVIFTMASVFCSNTTSVKDGVCFLLYQVIGVYSIGHLCSLLMRLELKTEIQQFAFEYSIGYVMQIINWYICMSIKGSTLILPIMIMEIIVLLLVCYIRRSLNEAYIYETDKCLNCALVVLLIIFIMIRFFSVLGANYIPSGGMTNENIIHHDTMWEIAMSVFAKNTFPMEDFRYLGEKLYYHYYPYVCNGVLSAVTGISCAKIIISLSFISDSIMLFSSVVALIQTISKKMWAILFGVILFFYTTGIEYYVLVTWQGHITSIPLGMDIGIALVSIWFLLLVLSYREKGIDLRLLLLISVFVSAAVGVKTPCAMVAMLPAGVICLFMIKNREVKKGLIYGIIMLFSFTVTYVFVRTGINVIDSGNNYVSQQISQISVPFEALRRYPIADILNYSDQYPKVIQLLLLLLRYFLYSQPAIFLLVAVSVVIYITSNQTMDEVSLVFLVGYVSGFLFTGLYYDTGASEMYFPMSSFIFGICFAISVLGRLELGHRSYALIALEVSILSLGLTCYFNADWSKVKSGYNTIFRNTGVEQNIKEGRHLRRSLCDMYEWIRNNSSFEDDILVSNIVLEDGVLEFDTVAFCERKIWLESSIFSRKTQEMYDKKELLRKAYSDNNAEALKQLSDDGVTIVISVKGLESSIDLNNVGGVRVIYENSDAQVARILK